MKFHSCKRSVIVFVCFLFAVFSTPVKDTKALGGISPNFIACIEEYNVYSETISQPWKWTQFTYMVAPSVTGTQVSRSLTLAISLGIDTGIAVDFNVLMAKTSVHYNLSIVTTLSETVTVTWIVQPSNKTTYLAAGELKQKVTGKLTNTYADCSTSQRTIAVTGTIYAFSESHY